MGVSQLGGGDDFQIVVPRELVGLLKIEYHSDANREREDLRLDYEQTNELHRWLADIRFKLLALVPVISGTAVAFLAEAQQKISPVTGFALGILGFVITLGIVLYDQ